ncbi:MAG: D-alanyl-D-alanine carboxypeptidase family protein [Candidatus Ancillula trichonymphae]|nr:D-alanyl-D-alanine carboxypeptidase family protein [Candidatus Ancillula trichonymphae]
MFAVVVVLSITGIVFRASKNPEPAETPSAKQSVSSATESPTTAAQTPAETATPGPENTHLTPESATAPFTKSNIIIVSKKHPLPKSWAPGENTKAVSHLKQLIAVAQKSGDAHASQIINQWSGYRSYDTQANLYANYVASSGVEAANTYSAEAGYSEHQTGLAFDLKDGSGNLYRINDSIYNYATDWVVRHAHEYGFVVRYHDEWGPITGYVGEAWHLRYLGVETATKVKNSGKTLEEFLGISRGNYAQ